jgi:hypothetical protein
MYWAVFKVDGYRLKNIGAKFFPCLCFSEDAVAKRARAIAAFLSVANFEDYLHTQAGYFTVWPLRRAILPRWPARAAAIPTLTGALGVLRERMQSRKFWM